eukprot:8976258-Pyramimonas_sp.AAC.1
MHKPRVGINFCTASISGPAPSSLQIAPRPTPAKPRRRGAPARPRLRKGPSLSKCARVAPWT